MPLALRGEGAELLGLDVLPDFAAMAFDEAAIGELFHAVGHLHDHAVVGAGDDGDAFAVAEVAEEAEDGAGGGGVEFAGGLVGEDEAGLAGERAGDGDALLFAAGEFVGAMVGAPREPDDFEGVLRALDAFAVAEAGDAERELDVLLGGEQRQQPERLEDEAELVAAQLREVLFGHGVDAFAVEGDFAAGGAVEAGEDVEQRGLAGAGAANEGEHLAGGDGERDIADGPDLVGAAFEAAGDAARLDGCAAHGCCLREDSGRTSTLASPSRSFARSWMSRRSR